MKNIVRIMSVALCICLLYGCAGRRGSYYAPIQLPLTPMPTQTEPTTAPTEPATEPSTEPTTVPTEPSTEPTTAPTEPVTEPTTEPTTAPTEPPAEPPAPTEEAFKLNKTSVTFTAAGQTHRLYEGGIDSASIQWGTYNEAVARCADGVITAVAKGYTKVYAEYEGTRYECEVFCNIYTEADRNPVMDAPSSSAESVNFFNDAIFIGDSVTLRLAYYAPGTGLLGSAQFIAQGSYGAGHAARSTMYVSFRGQSFTIQDAVKESGAKKVFLMMGMNDLNKFGIDKTIGYWDTMCKNILEVNPDVKIYVQSMTPVYTGGESGKLNNPTIDAYNVKLEAFAAEKGFAYVNVAPYMKDGSNGLAASFCSDKFVHLTAKGAQRWIDVLRAFADTQE